MNLLSIHVLFRGWRLVLIYFAFILCLLLKSSIARAQIAETLTVVGGSFAIIEAGNKAQSVIDEAHAAGDALIDRAIAGGNDLIKSVDEKTRERLDQIDSIAQKTIDSLVGKSENSVLDILDSATKDINDIKLNIVSDLKNIIWDINCKGTVYTLKTLPTFLGKLGHLLGTDQIELYLPNLKEPPRSWWCLWCSDPNVVNFVIYSNFDQTYIQVKNFLEHEILDKVKDETPAHYIVGTYENLSELSLITSCFFQNSSEEYNKNYIEYRNKAKQWRNVANIELAR